VKSPLFQKILVWDWPTRVGHWALVVSFAVAYASAESESWRLVHVVSGLMVGGIVAFRVFWGVVGTRHARFSNFVTRPKQVVQYLKRLLGGEPQHFTGHNPAGGLAILLMLTLCAASVASGWAIYNTVGPQWLDKLHDVAANFTVIMVLIHLLGVFVGSYTYRENLVKAMVTGRKLGAANEGISSARASAVIILVACVLAVVWYFY
jgi:cytochrome b